MNSPGLWLAAGLLLSHGVAASQCGAPTSGAGRELTFTWNEPSTLNRIDLMLSRVSGSDEGVFGLSCPASIQGSFGEFMPRCSSRVGSAHFFATSEKPARALTELEQGSQRKFVTARMHSLVGDWWEQMRSAKLDF